MRALELKIPPVIVGLVLGTMMALAARFTPAFHWTWSAGPWLAAGLAVAGVAIALLGVASFRRARTTVNPLNPEAVSRLVIAGIYHRTRNPMYLGMLLVLLGWGVWLAHGPALLLAAGFIPLMNRLQIIPEERFLAARFGADFTAYQSAVRRWL